MAKPLIFVYTGEFLDLTSWFALIRQSKHCEISWTAANPNVCCQFKIKLTIVQKSRPRINAISYVLIFIFTIYNIKLYGHLI